MKYGNVWIMYEYTKSVQHSPLSSVIPDTNKHNTLTQTQLFTFDSMDGENDVFALSTF